jgi:hypothetical protein
MKAPRESADERNNGRATEFDAESVERFAFRNGISRSHAYKEIAAGRLIARKIGTRTVVTREDAAKWRRALPKMSGKDAPNTREPSNDLPAWLSGPNPEHLRPAHPSRRRVRAKAPEATEPELDALK